MKTPFTPFSRAFLHFLFVAFFIVGLMVNSNAQFPDRYNHYREIPTHYKHWQKALGSYAVENLDSSLIYAQAAQTEALNQRDWETNLFMANFKAQLLGESGKPKEALAVLSAARMVSITNMDTLASTEYVENLFLTARVYTLLNDYKSSEDFFKHTASLLEQSGNYPEIKALAYYTLWQFYNKMMKSDLAHESIGQAVNSLDGVETDYARAILYFIQADRLNKAQLFLKADLFAAAAKAFELAGSTQDFLYFTTLMKLAQQFSSYQSNFTKASQYGMLAEQYAVTNRMSRAKVYGLNFALGDIYRSFNRYDEALPYFIKAKQITAEVFGTESLEYITANLYLGRLYRYMKQYENANRCFYNVYSTGIAGWKSKFPLEFTLYGEFGRLFSSWNKPDSALHYAQKRLAYEHHGESYSLHQIPPTPKTSNILRYYNSLLVKIEAYKQLYQQTNDTLLLSHGLKHCHYTLNLLDAMNEKALEEKSGLKNSSRTKAITSYAIYFSMEMNQFHEREENIRQAIQFCEKSNANYLKYLLSSKYIDSEKKNSDEVQLKSQINQLDIMLSHGLPVGQSKYDSLYSLSLTLKLQLANLVLNTVPINSTIGSDYRLNPSIPIFNIDSIRAMVPPDAALLIFHISNYDDDGEEFMLDQTTTSKRLITFLIDSERIFSTSTQLSSEYAMAHEQFLRSIKTADNENYLKYGQTLYKLFFQPISQLLESKKRVIIIPDESIADIPLESLPINPKGTPICSKLATSYHYSLGLWALSNRAGDSFQSFSLAAFAPYFSAPGNTSDSPNRGSEGETIESFLQYLPQLPMAEREVLQIGELFRTKKVGTIQVKHNRIAKQEFIDIIPKYDIIHIASHGFTDPNDFRNSGIYFSNSNSSKQSYELLHLNEIYNLNLQANLVVLSACKSNVGQIVQGEGAMALPRGFIYAGASNVLASLWKVHDEKTKDLMIAFYKHLLNGNSYAHALRLAKLDCIKKGFQPLDWAGFVMIGK